MFAKKIIAFDIGGTKILKAVVKIKKGKFEFLEIEEQKNPRKPEKIKKILLEYSQVAKKKYSTRKIALSAAYIIDSRKKTASQGKPCYGTDEFGFSFLENEGFDVQIENDGRCFALGEYFFGKGMSVNSILSLTLGTNIGGAFVSDGENFPGAHNSGMEVSYMNIFNEGKWSDWDDFCAGEGMEKMYKKAAGKKAAAKEIFELAGGYDKNAKKIVSQATIILGMGLANLLDILDPELVVFGGSISKQKKYIDQAKIIALKKAFNKYANYKFAISTLGNKANLLGAASLYLK